MHLSSDYVPFEGIYELCIIVNIQRDYKTFHSLDPAQASSDLVKGSFTFMMLPASQDAPASSYSEPWTCAFLAE